MENIRVHSPSAWTHVGGVECPRDQTPQGRLVFQGGGRRRPGRRSCGRRVRRGGSRTRAHAMPHGAPQ
eukprot:10683250-Alexandrium_andersonii.AAC.1